MVSGRRAGNRRRRVIPKVKVLAQRTAPDRAPVQHQEGGAENILTSAQAQTRIVGVPPRGYRVLAANELNFCATVTDLTS